MASDTTHDLEVTFPIGMSRRMRSSHVLLACGALASLLIASCGSDRGSFASASTNSTDPSKGGFIGADGGTGSSGGLGGPGVDGDPTADPVTCDAAASSKSYVGQ